MGRKWDGRMGSHCLFFGLKNGQPLPMCDANAVITVESLGRAEFPTIKSQPAG